jgi:hypothetical protein
MLSVHIRYGLAEAKIGDTFYPFQQHDSLQLEEVKFYLSGIELWNNNQQVWAESNSFHLIDAEQPTSMNIRLQTPSSLVYNQLKFVLGIDSVTNVSGAMGGDLDPTKGMYWTWQSGYVNMKLEGVSNRCSTRGNRFQFHIGGYQYPYETIQQITLPVQQQQSIHVAFDVKKVLEQLLTSKHAEIMSPGTEAVEVSKQLIPYFTVFTP